MIQDTQCERTVIGTFLSYGNSFHESRDRLSPECFTDAQCRELYRLICLVADSGSGIDIITVAAKAAAEGSHLTPADVAEASSTVCVADVAPYVARLVELEARRRLALVGQQFINASNSEVEPLDDVLNAARERIAELYRQHDGGIKTLREAVVELNAVIDCNRSGTASPGTPTGFSFIDKGGGLHEGDLVVVAGATSQGKTSFALSVALNAACSGAKVAFYSLEMTRTQLSARLVAMKSGVPSSAMLYGTLSDADLGRVERGIGELPLGGVFFDDKSTSSLDNIIASIRVMSIRHGIRGAVVDYLQILSVNMKGESNKELLMAEAARRLKNLAKELGIWVIALSQLSRDRDNPVPSIDRLRSSGQIAEAADMVMLVYRPEVYGRHYPPPFELKFTHNTAMIDLCKARNLGIGKFLCTFIPEVTLFTDSEPGDAPRDDTDVPF